MKLNQKQVQHFFLRSGFGQNLQSIEKSIEKTPESLLNESFDQSKSSTDIMDKMDMSQVGDIMKMSKKERRELFFKAQEVLKELNVKWLKRMVTTEGQLGEKMAFFWHDHFACSSNNPIFMQQYLEVLRSNAIGNFGDLLRAVSKTPAMLQFLNNQQNRKSSPNENFAREVMELFTMGRDQGYSEQDISEAARAFTGWGFNREGQFIFRKFQHDDGSKRVLGTSGNLNGDDVIDILLKKKETATYISKKWVQYFMNYAGMESLERKIADEFYRTNYDIKSGLEVLFTSEEFYNHRHIAKRIKSPIELIVSMQRQLHLEITNEPSLLYLQKTLGQMLFRPPNVAGWSDGKDWVDSATLMFRVNLPQLVFKSGMINDQSLSYDDNDVFKIKGKLKQLETELDSESMSKSFKKLDFAQLSNYLLQTEFNGTNPGGDYIAQIVHLTSKPEYQLC